MIIYTLSDPRSSNNIRYVGITKSTPNHRLSQHIYSAKYNLKSNRYLFNFIRKLIKDGVSPLIEILEEIKSEEDCCFMEIYWINQLRAWGFNLVNTSEGGRIGGVKFHTEETREKIKKALKRKSKKWHQERMEKIKKSRIGFKHTEEAKEKIKKNNKRPMLNKHLSEETKEKIRKKLLGRKLPEVVKKKMSEALIGRKMSKESIQKRLETMKNNNYRVSEEIKQKLSKSSPNKKAVLQFDLNNNLLNEFISINHAAKTLKINKQGISRCCNGKKKKFLEFIWRFKSN